MNAASFASAIKARWPLAAAKCRNLDVYLAVLEADVESQNFSRDELSAAFERLSAAERIYLPSIAEALEACRAAANHQP